MERSGRRWRPRLREMKCSSSWRGSCRLQRSVSNRGRHHLQSAGIYEAQRRVPELISVGPYHHRELPKTIDHYTQQDDLCKQMQDIKLQYLRNLKNDRVINKDVFLKEMLAYRPQSVSRIYSTSTAPPINIINDRPAVLRNAGKADGAHVSILINRLVIEKPEDTVVRMTTGGANSRR